MMNLVWQGENNIFISSCEVFGRRFRSRFSFAENQHIEDVLISRLAQAVAASLRSFPEGADVLALPEFLVEMPGLVLSGLHVMVTQAIQGMRSIILRFKEFLGTANRVFRTDVGVEEPAISYGQKLAVNVLEDICLPILNLCHLLTERARAESQSVNPNLMVRMQEFRFQTELLKRFISNPAFFTDERALMQNGRSHISHWE